MFSREEAEFYRSINHDLKDTMLLINDRLDDDIHPNLQHEQSGCRRLGWSVDRQEIVDGWA